MPGVCHRTRQDSSSSVESLLEGESVLAGLLRSVNQAGEH